MAPVFVSVCGLTERELPTKDCMSGVFVLKVNGLCVGGIGQDAFVIIIQNNGDKETDRVCSQAYQDKILLPFIQRQQIDCNGWDPNQPTS